MTVHNMCMYEPSEIQCLRCQRLLSLIVDWLETSYIYTHCSMVDIELASGFVETSYQHVDYVIVLIFPCTIPACVYD